VTSAQIDAQLHSTQATVTITTSARSQSIRKLRPLVVRFGAMGDMVILLSLVRALHERFDSPIDIVTSGTWSRALLERAPGVGTVHIIRSRKMPYLLSSDQWRLVRILRAREPGPVWDCDGNTNSRALLERAGIPAEHIVSARDFLREREEHILDRMLRVGAQTPPAFHSRCPPAHFDSSLKVPPLLVHERDRTDAQTWLRAQGLEDKPLVLIQAGNKRTMKWWRPRDRGSNTKYWPETRWAALIDRIAALAPTAEFLLCGVASEVKLNRSIMRHVLTPRVRDVAGHLPLGRLFAVQERALGMISVDTGPAHSAAAVGCPLLVLFGTEDPSHYLPRSKSGAVLYLQGKEHGVPSIRAIEVDAVVDAWRRLAALGVEAGRWRAAS
jgi:ADP-heptose:LPS heptosyltransferase